MFVLVVSEILGMFVKKLTAEDKYSLCNMEKLLQPIQLQLSEKHKIFLNFLLHIVNTHQMVQNLRKR